MALTAAHRQLLLDSAITPEVIEASGIETTTTGMRFPWSDGGPVAWQARPDEPRVDADGRDVKYEHAKGAKVPFNRLRDGETYTRLIIAEGSKQQYAVLSHAPADFAVYGLSGCWGFKHADMSVVEGRDVFLLLDADLTTNPDVYAAAEVLTGKLKLSGAKSVSYTLTTGEAKQGVDDVLAALPEERRAKSLRTWLAASLTKLPRRPKAKRPTATEAEADAVKLFRVRNQPLNFQPLDGAQMVLDTHPAAVSVDKTIALYRNGVYSVDPDAIMCVLALKLGNFYAPSYVTSTTHLLTALLLAEGKTLPERAAAPLLNCPEGMVDLRTGKLTDHDPKHLSYVQVAGSYDPSMATPVYDRWLREALRTDRHSDADVEALVADLEETAGTVLDPSRTPSKALFLFGASHSGKSTFLRLLKAIVGPVNTSAATLHQLSDDQFASADVYGKSLNVAADLSSQDVRDLSAFKMMTGEDPIRANRKYGKPFTFTNQALFAFSANALPSVSEGSRAYLNRVKPFEFPNSFEGREDHSLEAKLMAELPGILARWVSAYGRVIARGGYAASNAVTAAEFAAKSDRVAMFVRDRCVITEAQFGQKLPDDECTTKRALYKAFAAWVVDNGGKPMGETAFSDRLSGVKLTEVKNSKRARCLNIAVKPDTDELWDDEPTVAAEPGCDPWTAPADAEPVAVPAELEAAVREVYAADGVTVLFELPSPVDETAAAFVAAAPSFLDFNTDPETGQDYFA